MVFFLQKNGNFVIFFQVRKGMPPSQASKQYGMSTSVIANHAKNYPVTKHSKSSKSKVVGDMDCSDSDE